MSNASSSEIAMYRAAIALAWADHSLSEEEQSKLMVYMDNNKKLSDSQRENLKKDISEKVNIDDVWQEVTDVRDRAHVINIADAIFWSDGQLCHTEKEVLEKIRAAHMATLDLDAINEDIRTYRQELLVGRQQFQQELHEMRGPFARMLHYLTTIVDDALF